MTDTWKPEPEDDDADNEPVFDPFPETEAERWEQSLDQYLNLK